MMISSPIITPISSLNQTDIGAVTSAVYTEEYSHYCNVTEELTSAMEVRILSASRETEYLELTECSSAILECRINEYLFIVMSPILVILAIVGNSLTFTVMMRRALRRTATAVFLSGLAVSDTIAVLTGLSRHFVLKLTGVSSHLPRITYHTYLSFQPQIG